MKVLLIGSGDMGAMHARACKKIEGIHLCAVADPDEPRAAAFAREHGLPAMYGDYREALRREQPDLVSVCVPAFLHAEIAIAALEQGCHVLCEKPIALRPEDAEGMIEAADKAPGQLGIIFQRRYMGAWREVEQRLPLLGKPLSYQATDFRQVRPKRLMHDKHGNGGPVIDCCVHEFDMLLRLFGSPESVYAVGDVYAVEKTEVSAIGELAVDTVLITLKFKNGHKALVSYCWGLPAGTEDWSHTEIIGPAGLIKVFGSSIEHHLGNGRVETVSGLSENGHDIQIAACVDALRCGAPMPVPPGEALQALRVSYAALESIETGMPVAGCFSDMGAAE